MPAGASPKREREYKKLEGQFKKEGRYRGREEEVASRIVNKQRSQYGETKGEKQARRQGKSADRGLPLPDYESLTIPQVEKRLDSLSPAEIRKIQTYESHHKNRKGLMQKLERRLHSHRMAHH